jgi:hypothetical protein
MIVVGSSKCGLSRGSELFGSLLAVRDSLRFIARRRATPFAFIGVALDDDPRIGIEWLGQVGGFDEVSAGGSWFNTALTEYVWREPTALGATPQVIIELRTLQREGPKRYRPPSGEVLIRMIGRQDIIEMAGLRDLDSLLVSRTGVVPGSNF